MARCQPGRNSRSYEEWFPLMVDYKLWGYKAAKRNPGKSKDCFRAAASTSRGFGIHPMPLNWGSKDLLKETRKLLAEATQEIDAASTLSRVLRKTRGQEEREMVMKLIVACKFRAKVNTATAALLLGEKDWMDMGSVGDTAGWDRMLGRGNN